jgi:hypothetical protein
MKDEINATSESGEREPQTRLSKYFDRRECNKSERYYYRFQNNQRNRPFCVRMKRLAGRQPNN